MISLLLKNASAVSVTDDHFPIKIVDVLVNVVKSAANKIRIAKQGTCTLNGFKFLSAVIYSHF